MATRSFDLGRLPLLRAALFRLDDEEYFLVLVMHHIIADGWSMSVFRQELAASYDAFCQLITPKLPDLAIQYTDFAYWQRVIWPENTLDSQLHY